MAKWRIKAGIWGGMLLPFAAFAEAQLPAQIPFPFYYTNLNLAERMKALLAAQAVLGKLPCLTESAKENLAKLKKGTEGVRDLCAKELIDYQAQITEPMQGEGGCKGGFFSVAKEAHRRKLRSQEAAEAMGVIQSSFAEVAESLWADAEFTFDGGIDPECALGSTEPYDQVQSQVMEVELGFEQLRASLDENAEEFGRYFGKNFALGKKCASQDSAVIALGQELERAKAKELEKRNAADFERKRHRQRESDITGTKPRSPASAP